MQRSHSIPIVRRRQVSNIAQSMLSDLDRVRGTNLKLTLDIDAETNVSVAILVAEAI
jgi:hypothetical protein